MKKAKLYAEDYKKKLEQFMAEINPKPSKEVLEKILAKIQADQIKNSVRL